MFPLNLLRPIRNWPRRLKDSRSKRFAASQSPHLERFSKRRDLSRIAADFVSPNGASNIQNKEHYNHLFSSLVTRKN
jgi:hypothetical protein